ncbi:hypothetical protein ACOME3_005220 [Neoechinorhynchus agilis]
MRSFRSDGKSVFSSEHPSKPPDPSDDHGGFVLKKREQLLSNLELQQSQVLGNNFQSTSSKQIPISNYLSSPTKKWPYIAIFKSKPTLPKQIMYDQIVSPWTRSFKNDGIKRIDHLTYFAGTLRIDMVSHTWLEKLVNFSISNLPKGVYDVSYSSQKVQFLVKGIDPSITNEERENFEQSFNCKIKFFLNSRRTGQPISIAMVEGQRQVRDDLCTQQFCSFNCFEINFAMKSWQRIN